MKKLICLVLTLLLVLAMVPAAYGVEGDLDVLPDWDPNTYTVTYELGGGTNHPSNPATFTKNTALTFAAPTKEGATFGGWYKESTYKTPVTGIAAGTTQNVKVYAMWIKNFPDVKAGDWFKTAVDYISARNIISGTGDGNFTPGGITTRATLAQILYNMEGKPAVTVENPYTDVDANAWYAKAVLWATQAGVLSGYGDGRLGPNDPITREQLASMLWRHAGRPTPQSNTLTFEDAAQVGSWAKVSMCWAAENRIMQGYANKVNPQNTATRAEATQMIYKYLTK